MARCKHCEKGGLFQKVDKEGLCKTCGPTVAPDIEKHSNVIYEAMGVFERGKSFDEKLVALDELLESARHLQQYEAKGIDSCNPPPTPVVLEYSGFRDDLLKEQAG
jgi:hypothetical protein